MREIPESLLGPYPLDRLALLAKQTAQANAEQPLAAWLVLHKGRWEYLEPGPLTMYDPNRHN
jgi:hypothetical protein